MQKTDGKLLSIHPFPLYIILLFFNVGEDLSQKTIVVLKKLLHVYDLYFL